MAEAPVDVSCQGIVAICFVKGSSGSMALGLFLLYGLRQFQQ